VLSSEGQFSQILRALEAFQKTTQRTPPATIEVAERRLADWRQRGRERED
jgi:phage-related protein